MENDLIIANTWFKQHKHRLYKWTSPDGQHRNQVECILINRRWRSAVKYANILPGADCVMDHGLLVAKLLVKLRKGETNKQTEKL